MEILKQIVADRNRKANLSHIIARVAYYNVETETDHWMFPIDMNDQEDVGFATFNASEKAITLMRWIRKAIQNNSIIKIK